MDNCANNSEVMLSIYVATYNHEAFIAQALDSILMQKTRYTFEVLVGEDCSPDGTRAILQEYERKYPGRFQMFYRDHNMHHEKMNNIADLVLRCKGKYILALEGDDYWTDPYKLEKQISFLESHPEYSAVAHNCVIVDKFSQPNGEEYPECKDPEYTLGHFASDLMPGQLTTVMYRAMRYSPEEMKCLMESGPYGPGDKLMYFMMLMHGPIHCIQEKMSAYRHITDEGTSYSATVTYQFAKEEKFNAGLLHFARTLPAGKNRTIIEAMYVWSLFQGVKAGQCSFAQLSDFLKKAKISPSGWGAFGKMLTGHFVLRKKVWIQ